MTWKGRYGFIRAKPTVIDGKHFPSRMEAARYQQLALLVKSGKIRNLVLQPQYSLDVGKVHICNYRPDFKYDIHLDDGWHEVIEDVKGIMTDIYRLKKKLMLACHGINVIEPNVR